MHRTKTVLLILALVAVVAPATFAIDITMKIEGPGAINDTTIKAGEPVTFELYWANDIDDLRGFATGFTIVSKTIEKIVHVKDTLGGLTPLGDIKGYNGWENSSKWNFNGVMVRQSDWDGVLPDTIGFAGLVSSKDNYNKHEKMKVISWEMIVPEPGTIVVDSAFYPPGGVWEVAVGNGEPTRPTWDGPHKFKVVK